MFETERLILRQWREDDFPLFCEMNADPEVMSFFPATLSKQQSARLFNKLQAMISDKGWGWWAVELKSNGDFIGTAGLMPVSFESWFTPATEIGWRLRKVYWRYGYATEAASAILGFARQQLQLSRVVSFTACQNIPSIGVMEKLGMHRFNNTFMHPGVTDDSELKEHVLYEINWDQVSS